jgi:hypothetical protein
MCRDGIDLSIELLLMFEYTCHQSFDASRQSVADLSSIELVGFVERLEGQLARFDRHARVM